MFSEHPAPHAPLSYCCWWQIGDNKPHKDFYCSRFSSFYHVTGQSHPPQCQGVSNWDVGDPGKDPLQCDETTLEMSITGCAVITRPSSNNFKQFRLSVCQSIVAGEDYVSYTLTRFNDLLACLRYLRRTESSWINNLFHVLSPPHSCGWLQIFELKMRKYSYYDLLPPLHSTIQLHVTCCVVGGH